jgi:signal peptidase I
MSDWMEQMSQPSEPAPVEARPESGLHSEIGAWARDLVIAAALAAVIIVFFYQPVKVEGTSMAPSLSDQERIFINKFVYHVGVIERGDVVVFWYPLDVTKSFIKRVVGLPGDLVEIRQGQVYINGKPFNEPYVPAEYMDVSDYAPVRVQPGEYFVMGDHRASSNDSRIFGSVAAKYIYGKAVFAYWPMEQFGSISATAVRAAPAAR